MSVGQLTVKKARNSALEDDVGQTGKGKTGASENSAPNSGRGASFRGKAAVQGGKRMNELNLK